MFHKKKYMRFIAILTLLSCSCSLLAMKIPDKFRQKVKSGFIMPQETKQINSKNSEKEEVITDHDLKIIKNPNFQNAPDCIIPESIKVFYTPYLLKSPLLIDKSTIAFIASMYKIQILDLQTWRILKTIKTNTSPNVIVAWGKNSIVSGDDEGNIEIFDITKDHGDESIKTMKVSMEPIKGLSYITKNIFVIYNRHIQRNDSIFNDEDFEGFDDAQANIGFLNLKNIDKPQLTSIKCSLNGGLFYGIESAENDTCVFWNSDGEMYRLSIKNTNQKIHPFYKTSSGLSALKKLSNEKYIAGFTDGKTKIRNLKTKKKHKSSGGFFGDAYCPPTNHHIIDFLELPNNNGIICITPELIKFLDPGTGEWTHQIDCHNFLSKAKDTISSIFYAANKIFVIIKYGYVITCTCTTKDLNYLFQNLNISKDKKPFKDLGFKFKYNYNTEN